VKARTGGNANGNSTDNAVNGAGRRIVFVSQATDLVARTTTRSGDVFLRNMTTGVVREVGVVTPSGRSGNGPSSRPTISGDGRYVAFQSMATNLVAGVTNANDNIYVRDTVKGVTKLVSITASGAPSTAQNVRPQISTDGRKVAWERQGSHFRAHRDQRQG
jgi:Tol biopolymer transport system component